MGQLEVGPFLVQLWYSSSGPLPHEAEEDLVHERPDSWVHYEAPVVG